MGYRNAQSQQTNSHADRTQIQQRFASQPVDEIHSNGDRGPRIEDGRPSDQSSSIEPVC